MATQNVSNAAGLEPVRRACFEMTDLVRRLQGDAIGWFGLNPSETDYAISASGRFWRLRDYGGQRDAPSLLIVAAPIKRPYIWDLTPKASTIRYCLDEGLHVYMTEWLPASIGAGNDGLVEYMTAVSNCADKISRENPNSALFVTGHSLGGTLAAIFCTLTPTPIRGLVLLGAPLCFGPRMGHFRDALIQLVPSRIDAVEPYPGSLLSYASAVASPGTFIRARLKDALFSISDIYALDIHARVERWALDEIPLPGKLVHQIIDWLYRDNLFCLGKLNIGGIQVGPHNCSLPMLAAINTSDDVAPIDSVEPFIRSMHISNASVIKYSGETGVCLQHLSFLIGRKARVQLWPNIISWMNQLK